MLLLGLNCNNQPTARILQRINMLHCNAGLSVAVQSVLAKCTATEHGDVSWKWKVCLPWVNTSI